MEHKHAIYVKAEENGFCSVTKGSCDVMIPLPARQRVEEKMQVQGRVFSHSRGSGWWLRALVWVEWGCSSNFGVLVYWVWGN